MTKVYPNATTSATAAASSDAERLIKPSEENAVTLTVWKKSLLFNCNGFTVFDCKGNLVFRVDNYMQGNKGEILLMDAAGKPLLTFRRKRLSLGDSWLVYDGETVVNPRYSVRKHVNILNTKSLAHVSLGTTAGSSSSSSPTKNNRKNVMYEIEGSYAQRCCSVYDAKRRRVAEIKRKEAAVGGVAFGIDVFRLIVQPNQMESAVAMALVILLDQMFGGDNKLASTRCRS